MLGYNLKIACAKFQGNWFIIDGEINKSMRYRITKMNVAQGIVGLILIVIHKKIPPNFQGY